MFIESINKILVEIKERFRFNRFSKTIFVKNFILNKIFYFEHKICRDD